MVFEMLFSCNSCHPSPLAILAKADGSCTLTSLVYMAGGMHGRTHDSSAISEVIAGGTHVYNRNIKDTELHERILKCSALSFSQENEVKTFNS